MIKNLILLVGLSIWASSSSATFVNLDLEDFIGTGSDLLPGWDVTPGALLPNVDLVPISSEAVGLVSASNPIIPAIEGQYSTVLFAGVADQNNSSGVAIWQTAMVPLGATHISFVTTALSASGERSVSGLFQDEVDYFYSLGGIDLLQGATEVIGGEITRYTTPIHPLSGQAATLSFSVQYTFGGSALPSIAHVIDNIQFVPLSPAIWLFGSGLTGLLGIARRKKS